MQCDKGPSVSVHERQRLGTQVQQVIGKANVMLAVSAKGIDSKSTEALQRPVETTLVPHVKGKDIPAPKAVQRRFTQLVSGTKGLMHVETLNSLGIYSVQNKTQSY